MTNGITVPPREDAVRKYVEERDPCGIALLALLYDRFDVDFLQWAPEMRLAAFSDHMKCDLSLAQSSKLEAACQIMATDAFSRSAYAFSMICRALDGKPPREGGYVPPDMEQVLEGCTEARMLLEEDAWRFYPDVKVLAGRLLHDDGVFTKPSILSFADMPRDTPGDRRLRGNELLDHKAFWAEQQDIVDEMERLCVARFIRIADDLAAAPLLGKDDAFARQLVERASKLRD